MTIGAPPEVASGRELLEALPVAAVLLSPVEGDLEVRYAISRSSGCGSRSTTTATFGPFQRNTSEPGS